MGKLWLQCRLELELAVLQDVFLFLQCPEEAKLHPQDCWLCWSLGLSPWHCCLRSVRWAGFEFGPWNNSCSRVTDNARLMFAASCPYSVQLAGI